MISKKEIHLYERQIHKLKLRQSKNEAELKAFKRAFLELRDDLQEKLMEVESISTSIQRLEDELEVLKLPESLRTQESSSKSDDGETTGIKDKAHFSTSGNPARKFSKGFDKEMYDWALVENELRRWLVDRPLWNHGEWLDLIASLEKKGYSIDFQKESAQQKVGRYLEKHRPKGENIKSPVSAKTV